LILDPLPRLPTDARLQVRINSASPGTNYRVFRTDFFEYAAAVPALKASQRICTKNIETV
jgi:hypothetical protein